MFGLKADWQAEIPPRYFTLDSYAGGEARWCPGCGDFAVLTAVQKICRDAQLLPEKTVVVSGIGCSSRFPHYMGTYGFHGLHGRALPVACGVRARRPDLTVFVATGDGDCCSIGAGHWIHAIRYNMDMTVMLFDNGIYGLTKKQTSPTSPIGLTTNTHPRGAWLPPLNPTRATLGFTNVSFVAQTVDWNAAHLYETLKLAHEHKGTSFVRIMQRCPTYTADLFAEAQADPSRVLVLEHPDGVPVPDSSARVFTERTAHDPSSMAAAQAMADRTDCIPIGLFFRDETRPRYEDFTHLGLEATADDRLAAIERVLGRFGV